MYVYLIPVPVISVIWSQRTLRYVLLISQNVAIIPELWPQYIVHMDDNVIWCHYDNVIWCHYDKVIWYVLMTMSFDMSFDVIMTKSFDMSLWQCHLICHYDNVIWCHYDKVIWYVLMTMSFDMSLWRCHLMLLWRCHLMSLWQCHLICRYDNVICCYYDIILPNMWLTPTLTSVRLHHMGSHFVGIPFWFNHFWTKKPPIIKAEWHGRFEKESYTAWGICIISSQPLHLVCGTLF
jgi:hypothetical protein